MTKSKSLPKQSKKRLLIMLFAKQQFKIKKVVFQEDYKDSSAIFDTFGGLVGCEEGCVVGRDGKIKIVRTCGNCGEGIKVDVTKAFKDFKALRLSYGYR